VSNFIGCVPVAPSGECSRGRLSQSLCAVCGSNLDGLTFNPSVYSAALRGGC